MSIDSLFKGVWVSYIYDKGVVSCMNLGLSDNFVGLSDML